MYVCVCACVCGGGWVGVGRVVSLTHLFSPPVTSVVVTTDLHLFSKRDKVSRFRKIPGLVSPVCVCVWVGVWGVRVCAYVLDTTILIFTLFTTPMCSCVEGNQPIKRWFVSAWMFIMYSHVRCGCGAHLLH